MIQELEPGEKESEKLEYPLGRGINFQVDTDSVTKITMSYYFYILRCSDNSLYCGVTNNPEKRTREHNLNNSKASRFTRSRRPVELVYTEKYKDLKRAMRREAQVKKWAKAKKEALINGVFLNY